MPTEAHIRDALRTVTDPEYPVSIADLGMIYGVAVHGGTVTITMTFTSIGCPAMDMIGEDIEHAIRGLPGVDQVHIDVVWNPPWTKERISDRGRKVLAAHGVV